MIKGKTKSGFEYEIKDEVADDYELIEELVELDEDFSKFPKVVTKLLGKEQKKRLMEHLREENGIVPATRMVETIMEIFNDNQSLKN